MDSLPHVDVVRVWVADKQRNISLNSKIRLLNDNSEDRLQSRKTDGVKYSIQWCQGVSQEQTTSRYSSNSNRIVTTGYLTTPCESTLSYDTTFTVSEGDVIMFRLSARDNRFFDDAEWLQEITDTRTNETFKSYDDFYCWNNDHFEAVGSGTVDVDVDIVNDQSNDIIVFVYKNSQILAVESVESGIDKISVSTSVNAGDNISVHVEYDKEPQWAKVVVNPVVTFYSDSLPNEVVYRIGSTIDGGVSHISFRSDRNGNRYEAYSSLFGELHKNWGQFAYKNKLDYDEIIQLIDLSSFSSDMSAKLNDSQKETSLRNNLSAFKTVIVDIRDNAQSGGSLPDDNSVSMPDFMDEFNPYSDSRCWISMQADVVTQRWIALGNLGAIGDSVQSTSLQAISGVDTTSVDIVYYDSSIPISIDGSDVKTIRKHSYSYHPSVSVGGGITAVSANAHISGGFNEVTSDFMDMNGDGYPDFIGKNSVQYTNPWGGIGDIVANKKKSYMSSNVSAGAGLSGSKSFVKEQIHNGKRVNKTYNAGLSTSTDYSYSKVNVTYIDVNGDGLPDMVHQGGGDEKNRVCYNIGYGFTDEYELPNDMEINTSHNLSSLGTDNVGLSARFDIEQHSISGGVSYNESKNTTTYSMIDLDGDGYLDKVHFSGSLAGGDPTLEVSRNMFNQKWEGPTTLRHCNNPSSITSNVSTTASFTAGFTMMGVKVLANPQLAPYSRSKTESKMELLDMNGDGFVDLVDGGVVYYNVNGLQPTNLLTSVTNPTGHVIDLNYTQSEPTVEHAGRSWLLASAYDHLPTGYDVDKRASMGKKFVYKDAYFDTYEKSDYGYDTVRTIEYNNAGRVYRELVQIYANEDFINHGELQQDSLSDGHHPYVVNRYNTLFGHVDAPNKVDVCDDKNMVRFREEYHTCYYEGHPTAEIETAYMLEYDQYHNMIRRMDWGDVAVNNDDIEQLIIYRTPSQHNLISLPIKEEVRSGGNAIRLSEMDYNAVGSPIAIRLYNNTTISETNMQYDVYGNMIEALSPENGNRERLNLHYAYDPETETYPVFICNQFGETQLTKYDIRFGVPLIVVDPTGTAIQYRYDPMGRLIDIIAPQEDNVNMPTVHYDYHLPFHNVRPYIYSSSTPDFGFPLVTKVMFAKTQLSGAEVTLYDARGADLQKKVWQNVGGINMWVVQGHTEMDEFGRVIGMTTPFKSQTSVGTYDPNWQGTSAAMTNMKYDIMDRKRAVIHPDGKDQQFDFDFAYDYQNILRFCQTVKNENGISSISLLSPQGWNIQQINPMGQVTKFRYNALGELLAATDADGYTTQYQYDLLGRMTERSHPDAGRTQWSYDAMGNMVTMNTEALRQAGLVIKYSYSYNRLVEVNYPIHKDLDVKYKYYSDGRLAQREDACGTEDFTYDELGNVKQSDRWIYVPSENKAFLFVHRYNYDSFGRIQSIVYPDNDSVTYHYCESGQLDYVNHTYQGVTSPIIKSYEYDEAGRKTRIVYGNNVLSDFQYSQDRNWLKRTATFSPVTNSILQNLSYQYDAVGNITDITQAAGPANSLGGNYHNHYDYDNLNRLVDSYSRGGAFDYDFQITMSPTGRIGRKFLNTPSGNVLSDQTHGYDIRHTTHQPRVVFDAARGYQSLFWDANGNLSQSIDCNTGGAQLNFWDEENRLRMTVNPKHAGYYGYDASGERVYKLTGHTQYDDMNGSNPLFGIIFDRLTLYPSPYIVLSEKQYTKHFYAGTEKIATLIGDGGLLLKEGSLEPEHIGRLKEGFYQSFHIDPSQFNYTKNVDIQDKAIDEVQYQCKYIEQVDIKLNSIYPMLKPMLDYWKNVYGNNNDIFYTHANHLGSASWITDKDGLPVQYIHYAPYGEFVANQQKIGYDERFKFTGKERDEESGYDFFGARYYDHRKGFWNSVDPLADKYPNVTPYLYCDGNPIMLVDPDGREFVNKKDAYRMMCLQKRAARQWHISGKTMVYWMTHRGNTPRAQEMRDAKLKDAYIKYTLCKRLYDGIEKLRNSSHKYTTNVTSSEISYGEMKDGIYIINFNDNLGHETSHAIDFENGLFSFPNDGTIVNFSSGVDPLNLEKTAYQTEFLIDQESNLGKEVNGIIVNPSTLPLNSIDDITEDWVEHIVDSKGNPVYIYKPIDE